MQQTNRDRAATGVAGDRARPGDAAAAPTVA